MNDSHLHLIVIGGGIVGLATAYKWQLANPNGRVTILEKEKDVAKHQTGRNSGVIHSGIYYKPDSLKAKTCKDGYAQLVQFVRENEVDHDICGKLIVATSQDEVDRLQFIYERGVQNGLEGLQILDPEEMHEIEPHVRGVKAIKVPQTGIVDYVGMCRALLRKIQELQPNSSIYFDEKVLEMGTTSTGLRFAKTANAIWEGDLMVACGGLEADRLAKLDNVNSDVRIVPFRGDYYDLTPSGVHKVKHLIYPVPDPRFPFLGVHFTRMVHGGVECGPNAVFSFKREGYSRTDFSWKDSLSALTFKGTWKLFSKHWEYGIGEYKRAFSKAIFLSALQKLIPGLMDEDIKPARAGVRAQALRPDGNLVDDFVIERGNVAVHVINAPSPAATASLAIADEILSYL